MKEMIGILCAGDDEVAPFLKELEVKEIVEKAMLKFYVGTLCNQEVVVLYSGVAKVNAAIAAQILIDCFHVSLIINAGTAGAIAPHLSTFDVVIGERFAYHDVQEDILTDFHPWLSTPYFQADKVLVEKLKKHFEGRKDIHFGMMVTGEAFIEEEKRDEIIKQFHPLSVDMESASVAHVAYVNRIPFLAIRSITDTPEEMGEEVFERNCLEASCIAMKVTLELLQIIKY